MKQNKFLTGFLIVTLLGAGALGVLLFQAKGKHTEATTAYTEKVTELEGLYTGKPFPNEANYKRVLELQKQHQEAIASLQQQLAAAEIPVEPLTPEKFQDNLRQAINRVRTLAAQMNTQIGEGDSGGTAAKLTLGFEVYESQPPKPEAAPQLGRMLKAIEMVVTELLQTRPARLNDIKRTPLPEEGLGAKPAPATPAPKVGSATAKKTVEQAPLVKRYPFDLEFEAIEPRVRTFINKIVSNKQQFCIPAQVTIANKVPTGPSKSAGIDSAPPPPVPDPNAPLPDPNNPVPPAAPQVTPAPASAKLIVGDENLAVGIRFEVVDFAEPAPEKSAEKPVKPAAAK